MNLYYRRILYTFFILLFCILSPLVIFFAIGYRYDFKNSQIIKNGLLILEPKPAKVNVFINNELKYVKTPIIGQSFKPGFYDLSLSKPGYYSWKKNFEIKSGLTTFFQDVILFKKVEPIKIIDGNFSDFTLSPDESSIITLWQDNNAAEIWNYDSTNHQGILSARKVLSNSQINIKAWSAHGKNLLFNNEALSSKANSFFIISFLTDFFKNTETQITELDKIIKQSIIDAKWDDDGDDILFVKTAEAIYRLDLKQKNAIKIFNSSVSDFIVYDKILIFDHNLSCLLEIEKNYEITTPTTKDQCKYLLPDKNYQLLSSPRGLITLVDSSDNNELLVIDLNNKKKILQSATASNIKWNNLGDKMLYYDEFEVNTFSPGHEKSYQQEVISRYSQPIKKAIWYAKNHHLIVLLNDDIKIAELDARDKRNIVEITGLTDLKNIYIDQEGKNLYVLGKKDNEEGIFQININ